MFSLVFRHLVDFQYLPVYGFLATLLILSIAACNGGGTQFQAPTAKKITTADLQKLRWIEGSWRGTGVNQPPFFERYRFESDTILAVDHFEDETLAKVTKTSKYELKDGEFRDLDGSHVATALDDNMITFEPLKAGSNVYGWKRDSKDAWTAVLSWQASGNRPAGERIYKLERFPKP